MSKNLLVFGLFLSFIFQSCGNSSQEIKFHKSHEPSRANVPFSDAVETGNLLFLTGQIGKDHKVGKLVTGGIMS